MHKVIYTLLNILPMSSHLFFVTIISSLQMKKLSLNLKPLTVTCPKFNFLHLNL